jgi:CubicO group peptidase (beta-lactamase class C family)
MQRGVIPNSGPDVLSRHTHPLVFQPGSQWLYGTGIDWAGLAIERLTKSSLEEFMKSNIWDPLNAKTITFFPARTAGLETRIPSLSARGPDSKLYPYNEPFINSGVTGCFGGSGGYASLSEYLRLLTSLLRNDGKILKPASVDELFSPQLTDAQAQSFKGALTGPVGAFFIGEFQAEKYKHDWAFGGAVSVEGYEDGRRRAGTLTWGGMANTFWMIDREAGVAVTFGTQLLPPGDVEVRKVISVVEKEVYKMAGVA